MNVLESLANLSRSKSRRRQTRQPPPSRGRAILESLEDRTAPAGIIDWTNAAITSGSDNNYFYDVFGTNGYLAERVVQAAIDEWSAVITGLNGAGNCLTVPMKISMNSDPANRGTGAVADTLTGGAPRNAGGQATFDWFFVDAYDVITNLKKPGDLKTKV